MYGAKSSVQIATVYVNINSMWVPRHDTIQRRTWFCISHMKVFLVLDVCVIIHGGKKCHPNCEVQAWMHYVLWVVCCTSWNRWIFNVAVRSSEIIVDLVWKFEPALLSGPSPSLSPQLLLHRSLPWSWKVGGFPVTLGCFAAIIRTATNK